MTTRILFACLLAGARLGAQSQADTVAILKAAVPAGGHMQFLNITGDTAVVVGMIVRQTVDTAWTKDGRPEIATLNDFDDWEARVERRGGRWVRVSRRVEKRR